MFLRAVATGVLAMAGLCYAQDPAPAPAVRGTVVIRVVVGTDGVPFHPVILQGIDTVTDRKALESVAKWRFRPGLKNDKPVPVFGVVEINFDSSAVGAPFTLRQQIGFSPRLLATQEEALREWYVDRARSGDVEAQLEAARRLGVKGASDVELVQAWAWAKIAARADEKQASRLISKLRKRLNEDEIRIGDQMAEGWKPGSALRMPR